MKKYRSDIDALRALSLLGILFYHVDFSWMPGGYVGVDVFFVISGYLISTLISEEIARTGGFDFRNFYVRRARRLFPALFVVIAGTFAFGGFVLAPGDLTHLSESVLAAIFSGANFLFFAGSGYFAIGKEVRPLLHTWSLGVEEQFYLVWPFLLWLTGRRGGRLYSATLLITLAASFCAGLAFVSYPSAVFYLLPFRVWELALGAACAFYGSAKSRGWSNEAAYAIGVALVLGSAVFLTKDSLYPFYNALAPCCGAALMLYSGQVARIAAPFRLPPLVALGKISYSAYLIHWPLVVYYKYLIERPLHFDDQLILVAVTIFIAVPLYFLVEKRFRYRRASAKFEFKPMAVSVALVSIALICVTATSVILSGGWVWRYPRPVRLLLDKAGNDIAIPHPLNGCFLMPAAVRADIREGCYAPVQGDPRPAIILVGDSTAYALAAGLQQVLGKGYQVLVWTAASCPALYGIDFPNRADCLQDNKEFFEHLVNQYKYNLVIFSNNNAWPTMLSDFHTGADILERRNIDYVLLGQMIVYRDIPLSIIARHGLENLDEVMRRNLTFGCTDEYGLDRLVPKDRFFSMKKSLCNGDYPVYSINGSIAQADTLHLTDAGSVFVAEKLKPWLLENGHLPSPVTPDAAPPLVSAKH